MNNLSSWENIFLIILSAGAIFWFFPGIKQALRASENAPKDWPAIIIPLLIVVGFVLLLIQLV